jgi:CDP-glycerol glycerophosphotransferase (TagB/SpsB family)
MNRKLLSNDLMLRGVLYLIRLLLNIFISIKKNRIIFLRESNSGSNTYALFKFSKVHYNNYDLILLDGLNINHTLKDYVIWYSKIVSSKLIFTTHISLKPSKKHIHFQLWHGGSTKKMGVMEHGNEYKHLLSKSWREVDYIMSYSDTYTTFLNACMVTHPNKYVVTGAPRNDLLLKSNGLDNLYKIFGEIVLGKKIIWFAPTFRDYFGRKQGNKSFDNPFGFNDFLVEDFDKFLNNNNILFIIKPHPQEENLIVNYFNSYQIENLIIFESKFLEIHDYDFYELLNSGQILITDYSSIFYDYLLLNRPIIFTPVDYQEYENDRGFLMESYLNYVPGAIALTFEELKVQILSCINSKDDLFIDQRKWILNFHHRFKDSNSSQRIMDFILQKL